MFDLKIYQIEIDIRSHLWVLQKSQELPALSCHFPSAQHQAKGPFQKQSSSEGPAVWLCTYLHCCRPPRKLCLLETNGPFKTNLPPKLKHPTPSPTIGRIYMCIYVHAYIYICVCVYSIYIYINLAPKLKRNKRWQRSLSHLPTWAGCHFPGQGPKLISKSIQVHRRIST